MNPLDAPVESLPGIGEVTGQSLRARGLSTAGQLPWVLPLDYLDERAVLPIARLSVGERQVTAGEVVSARVASRGRARRMAEVVLRDPESDEGITLRLVWFRAPGGLISRFREGARFRVVGEVSEYRGQLCMNHPQTELIQADDDARAAGPVPRYPEVRGVAPRVLARAIAVALQRTGAFIEEAVPGPALEGEGLPSLLDALRALHAPPQDMDDATLALWNDHRSDNHVRLAFEEFFLLELALQRRRVEDQGVRAHALVAPAAALDRVRKAMPFELTSAQHRVAGEIDEDLRQDRPMRRLLQGDVGSGKTAVALLAAAHVVAAGSQVAFMAPTEVLAEQHVRSIGPLAEALGLRAALVVGGARASHRNKTRRGLSVGTIDLAIGTHALLSEGVEFHRLGLVIVDEQHRFGVGQRLSLVGKSGDDVAPHLLVMTATPIPRTLMLALHGDLSASVLDEMPPGRLPPVTRAYPMDQREAALKQLERGLDSGGQAFVVCPTIDEDGELDLRSAVECHRELSARLGDNRVGLLHGRLDAEDKQEVMERFIGGSVPVLVSTTIVEVGVDVPAANVMLVEHAERFGLAQLHQLRGRVGRAGQRSACLLVHDTAGDASRARIDIMCETTDGFRIAEEDLRLRGPGELFGRKQSGLPGFRFGDLRRDGPLLARAREAALRVIERDADLVLPEHSGARAALDRMQRGATAVVKEEAG